MAEAALASLFPDWWISNAGILWSFVHSPEFTPGLIARYALQGLALSLPIFVADFLFGAALLRALRRPIPPLLRAATALAIGAGAAGTILFLFAHFYRIRPRSVVGLAIGMAILGAAYLTFTHAWRWTFSFLLALRPRRWLAALVVALVLLPVLALHVLDLMLPVIEYDSTMYHMSAARLYRETTHMPYHGGIRFNAQPHLPVLLYLRHWIVVGDDSLLKFATLEFSMMLGLVVLYAARESRLPGAAALGLLFVASSPVFFWTAKVEYADFPLACFLGVAGALLFQQFRRPDSRLLVPAGIVLGFAASSKLQGVVLAACAGAGFVAAALVARRPAREMLRGCAWLAALVTLSGAGWWIRSWISTGSPVYPFLSKATSDAEHLFRVNASYGAGRDLVSMLLLPWRMITIPPHRFADPYIFGVAMLLLLAVVAIALLRRRDAFRAPEIVFLIVTAAAFFLFWFRTGQVMRYLASLLPLLAILFLALLARVRANAKFRGVLAALLALASLHATLAASSLLRWGYVPPVTYAQREILLASSLPFYRAARELNAIARPRERTYLLFCDEARYYVRTTTYGDWFGDYSYLWLGRDLTTVEQMLARLRGAGFRYLIVDRDRAAISGSIYAPAFRESGFARRFVDLPATTLIYSDARFGVYRLQ